MTHDYKRNGTTTLFAALNTLDGTVLETCMPRHRHQEWIKFLNLIKRNTPPDKEIHIICDNYATHKHAKVKAWMKRNKRFHVHFTPTSASWLNMIERFFRDISEQRLRCGVFRSVNDLIAAITYYVAHHNKDPKPFIWKASASDIFEKVKRARTKLDTLQSLCRTALAFEPALPDLQLFRRWRLAIDDAIVDEFDKPDGNFQFPFLATASNPKPDVLT